MVEIFGFVDDAAAVDSHLRDGALRWRCVDAKHAVDVGHENVRSALKQHLAPDTDGRDIICGDDGAWIVLLKVLMQLFEDPQISLARNRLGGIYPHIPSKHSLF